MAQEVFLVSQYVAAGAMLLLAGWLLWLNFRSRVNRAFALFLVFRALVILSNQFKRLAEAAGDERSALLWQTLREYYFLALAPTLLYFWVVHSGRRSQVTWLVVILAVALLTQAAYMADHCLSYCSDSTGLLHLGPISALGNPAYLLTAGFVGLWILRDSLDPLQTPRSKAAFPVAVGLLLIPLLETAIFFGLFSHFGAQSTLDSYAPSTWVVVFHAVLALAIVPPLGGLFWTFRVAAREPDLQTKAKLFGAVALLAAASGFNVGWNVGRGVDWLPGVFYLGVWRILLPALVAYALVRHRLFGVEVRLRWALVRATMAFVFLGVFFVVAQLAQNYLSATFGWGLGGISAGLLLFVISPLQAQAERFGKAVLPNATPVAAMAHPERVELFRHQAILVWSDGTMGRKERAMLDALRQRLGVPLEEAVRIEAEAAQSGSGSIQRPGTGRNRSPIAK